MTIIDQILFLVLVIFSSVGAYKDIKTRKIPNWIPLTLFIIWIIAFFVKWILASLHILNCEVIDVFSTCVNQVITSAVICCLLAACVVFVNKIREKRGQTKHSVFGMGDVKLLMVVCLYFGFSGSFICIFVACICFLLYALIYNFVKSQKILAAPFAPFILCGIIFAILIINLC